MMNLSTLQLDSLPAQETDDIEYKSSATPEKQLKREIQHASSAFWNSGGGLLLAGIADDGTVDGGIPTAFGKQSLSDWLDQVLASTRPSGQYSSRAYSTSDNSSINTGMCVLAIQFHPSSALPHQSADRKYYIRAGAHTVPASHDIVDALHAKRHFQNPRLVHLARLSHVTSDSDFLHIEIIAATDAVALDVNIALSPKPTEEKRLTFPIVVPIIDREHSFGFRVEVPRKPAYTADLVVGYQDLQNHEYSYTAKIAASEIIPPWNHDLGTAGLMVGKLADIAKALERPHLGPRFT